MEIRGNIGLASKVFLILLLVIGLVLFGCAGIKTAPEGGSGGVVADGALLLCPSVKQAGGIGCTSPVVEGKLVAVNTVDGSRLWDVSLKPSASSGGYGCAPAVVPAAIYGNPAVAGDLVYVGGYSGKIYAISFSSRSVRWVYPRDGSLQPIVGGVVVAWGKVYFGCSDGKLYALDAATGDIQPGFPFPTGAKIWSAPTIDGDTLYIGSFDKKLYALNAGDGTKKWEFSTEGAVVSAPLVYGNTVYFGCFDRHFYAINAADGKLKWQFEAGGWFWAKPVIYEDIIYAPCLDGKVYALQAKTGDKINEFDLAGPLSSSPVLVSRLIVIASEQGKVYALDTSNNKIKPLAELKEAVYAPLSTGACACEGVVYIFTAEQNLYALNTDSGAKVWSQSLKY